MLPTDLVDRAKKIGLNAIAITDHDTSAGVAEAIARGNKIGIEVIPGIEISSWYGNVPMHLLGYWFRYDDEGLNSSLCKLQNARIIRNMRILQNLNNLGIKVTADDLKSYSQYGQTGRPHIAQLLVDKGVVKSLDAAFIRYLKRGAAAYADRFKYNAEEAIQMIKGSGGFCVLAHPACLDPTLKIIPDLLDKLKAIGLEGIEVYYPSHTLSAIKQLKSLAEAHDLLITGGSDFHGDNRSKAPMGGGKGLRIPASLLEKIRSNRMDRVRKIAS